MLERETREVDIRLSPCGLFLAVGSSLVVYPDAQVPPIVNGNGDKLIMVHLTLTPHDRYADIAINEKTGQVWS